MSAKSFIPLGVFALLVVVFGIGLTLKPRDLPSQLIDQPLPEFVLPSVFEGQPDIISSEIKGAHALLNVFGSWCVACRVEHPFLMELQNNNEIQLIGLDWRDTRPAAQEWLTRNGNPYHAIGFDEFSEVAIDLGVTGAPESYLIDKNGRIRYKYIGPLSREVWTREISPILRQLEAEE